MRLFRCTCRFRSTLKIGARIRVGIDESIRVLELPTMFKTVEELDYVADKMWPYFQKKFEKKGYKLSDGPTPTNSGGTATGSITTSVTSAPRSSSTC